MRKNWQTVQQMMMRLKIKFENASTEVLEELAPIAPTIEDFNRNLDLIAYNEEIQSQNMTGFTEVKAADRSFLEKAAIDCAKRGRSYGLVAGLPGLVAEISKTKSWYLRASDLELVAHARVIKTLLTPLLTETAPYGMTSAKLTNLGTRITTFNTSITAPKENTNDKKIATDNIVNLISDNTALLIIIDAGVDNLEESQPDFWRSYRLSRKLTDANTHTMALKISVTTEDRVAIGNVKISIVKGTTTVLKKTTAKGNCQVQNMLPGTYIATFTKYGYEEVKKEININDGERTVVNLVMNLTPVEA